LNRLYFLNGFRALAAFWVVSAHCMIWGGWYGIPLPSAKLAVDLFMVISGYLMVVHADERDHNEPLSRPVNWLRFYTRRLFRLAPAYYVSLALVIAIAPIFLGGYSILHHQNPAWGGEVVYNPDFVTYTPANVLWHVTFLFGLSPEHAFSTFLPDWSLSLEMQFYVAFPVLLLAFRRLGEITVTALLCAACIPVAMYLNGLTGMRGGPGLFVEPSFLPLKLQYFLIGMLMARMKPSDSKARSAAMWTICLALTVSQHSYYGNEAFYLTGLVLVMLICTGHPTSLVRRSVDGLSRLRAIDYMSRSSYSVYLFHGVFIALTGRVVFTIRAIASLPGPGRVLIMWVIVVTGAYTLASLVERTIENPGIAFGKALLRRWKRHSVPGADAAV
jgi:peptidoglycan/LPS O-acetylase OafA/YrhL